MLRRVLDELPAANLAGFSDFGAVVRLPGVAGSISPGLIAAGLAAAVVVALVVARAVLEKFGGDSLAETRRNIDGYLRTLAEPAASQVAASG